MVDPSRTGTIGLRLAAWAPALAVFLAACGGAGERPPDPSIRLVDRFPDADVLSDASARERRDTPPAIRWTFDASPPPDAWTGHDVIGFGVRDGALRGRTVTETAVVHAERTAPVDDSDLLHAVEIVLRVNAGGELAVRFDSDDTPDLQRALGDPFPWPMTTPVVPGDEAQRYTLTPARPVSMGDVRHVLVRPVDAKGVTFEIASVAVVSRREHLAAIDSGVGWHGMDDVFRETIVTRAAETVAFHVALGERPWLDLALATVEDGPATFRIEAVPEGDLAPVVFERTVSRPHRWNPARLALDDLAGRRVRLSLRLEAPPASLGFWGSPAIRHGSMPDAIADGPPQGVIVVLADTLRADRVGAWGHDRETAPVLAGLAAEGVRAADCVSQATWTKVSVPSIVTSMYPTSHTVSEFTDRLPAAAETMAEVFREAGYATLALTSISFVGQFTNLHQGYEELHESSSLNDSSDAKTAREYVDRLLPWLETHRDVPFFVFLHVADPHSPYRPYAPFDTEWGEPGDLERLAEHIEQVRPHIDNPIMRRFGMPTRSELQAAGVDASTFVDYELDAYDGSILGMDVEIGRLLERLRELDLADRVLLAFVSDHGTEFLDHDRHFHGHTVYGELNRVPMFLWSPGRLPPNVVLEPTVQTIDLMPTVLELAGLAAPDRIQGRSLVPLIRQAERGGTQAWPRPAITEKAVMGGRDLPGRSFASVSLIDGGWKLIHNDPAVDGVAQYELFDHRDDPLNRNDLAAERPDRVRELADKLDLWRRAAAQARLDDAALEGELDAEELERLRSLGYLN